MLGDPLAQGRGFEIRQQAGQGFGRQAVRQVLVRAAGGIGGMQCLVGDTEPMVEHVAPSIALPSLPVWLTAPEVLRQTPRIRRVFHHLAQAFLALRDLDPAPAFG